MDPNFSTAPSFTVRTRSASNSAGRAFVVEALVLVAFLAASVAIVLQVFAAAGVISREAHTLSMSEHLAMNAAEQFGANPVNAAGTVFYTSTGEALPSRSTATFSVDTAVTQETSETGALYHADITVTSLDGEEDGAVTYSLQTERYLPGANGPGMAQGDSA